ncbi:MAG: thiamine/thiamine pyrophosphate ABC transporter permease ThiP [Pseudomonadota bacterium]
MPLLLIVAPIAALLAAAPAEFGIGRYEWAALRFTLLQATLSAGLSALLAIPLARALARRRFPGRAMLTVLLGAPFVLPAIVAVLGLTAIWGRAGPISDALASLGAARLEIYGLSGVVLGHVFFNLPLVTRMLVQGWAAVPPEHWRLASHLGMSPAAIARHIERPILREVLPGALLLVFLLSMTSFAVALTLGGGPAASTLEVAIYEAVRFDFAPGRAAVLGALQLALGAALAVALLFAGRATGFEPGLQTVPQAMPAALASRHARLTDGLAILVAAAFLVAPLAAVALRGAPGLIGGLPAAVWEAAAVSLALAGPAALLSLVLAMGIASLTLDLGGARGRAVEAIGLIGLATSPLVLGSGLFLLLRPMVDPFALALPVTVLVNAAMSLPFALRLMLPAYARLRDHDARLADSLGMTGWARLRLVTWPALRRPAGVALGLAAALSAGDLGVIALFAPPQTATLPLEIYRLMGAYRMDDAMGAALLLLMLSLGLFWLSGRIGGRS